MNDKLSSAIKIEVKTDSLDMAIEKANHLVSLLHEAKDLIDSLSGLKT